MENLNSIFAFILIVAFVGVIGVDTLFFMRQYRYRNLNGPVRLFRRFTLWLTISHLAFFSAIVVQPVLFLVGARTDTPVSVVPIATAAVFVLVVKLFGLRVFATVVDGASRNPVWKK